MSGLTFKAATPTCAPRLANLRVAAMRASLEAVGRFDPARARQRLIDTFVADDTTLLLQDADEVGFFVVRHKPTHLWFDHLYVHPSAQGKGIGRFVVKSVQNDARQLGKPIELMALKDSPANGFYMSLGFQLIRHDGFDSYYKWTCAFDPTA